ncbi:hypothetical protein Tco_0300898 [Tanacetum coccineum]
MGWTGEEIRVEEAEIESKRERRFGSAGENREQGERERRGVWGGDKGSEEMRITEMREGKSEERRRWNGHIDSESIDNNLKFNTSYCAKLSCFNEQWMEFEESLASDFLSSFEAYQDKSWLEVKVNAHIAMVEGVASFRWAFSMKGSVADGDLYAGLGFPSCLEQDLESLTTSHAMAG